MVRIQDSIGELELINARDGGELVESITSQGIDLDRGMVLILNGQTYCNSDTIHTLALISSPSDFFNKFNYWVFKSKYRTYFLYPVLRLGRNILLKIMGKKKLNNLKNT